MKYYFIGIKGSGMSALAIILKQLGNQISGSDVSDVYFTDANLSENKIGIDKFGAEFDADIVILGNAFSQDHVQVVTARKKGIKIVKYIDFISQIASEYNSVAIAGTNGKTTTTGLFNAMYSDDKICLIGDGTGYASKSADTFIFEACEYKGHFTNYFVDYAIINNIEMDHPDFFTSLSHVVELFQEFANNSKCIIVNGDDENCLKLVHENMYTFGLNENCDLRCVKLVENQNGYQFELIYKGSNLGEFSLAFSGMHMVYNALGSLLTGLLMGKDIFELVENINTFKGVKRRFETTVINESSNIVLIDDYAHHPTAIDFTLNAIRQKYPNHTISVLFQPHTYSRTIEFLSEFAQSLKVADELFLLEIFGSVRESSGDVDINILKDELKRHDMNVHEDIEFLNNISSNNVIALLGAGDIDKLYKDKIIDMLGV